MVCGVCNSHPVEKVNVCGSCRSDLANCLWDIRDLYEELPDHVAPSGGSRPSIVGGISGTKAKPVPVRIDVIDLLAPARFEDVTDRTDQVGHFSVATVFASWVLDWRDSLFPTERLPSPSVVGMVPWLRARLDYACDNHSAIADFAMEIRKIRTVLRHVCGLVEVSNEVDEAYVAQKLASVKASMFTRNAGVSVPNDRLDALLSATEVAMLAGVSKMTVSNWRKTEKLTPAQFDKSGHAQYRLGDVLSLTR